MAQVSGLRLRKQAALRAIVAAAMIVLIAGVSCGSDGGSSEVTGRVVSVVPASLTGVAALELVDEDGVLWQFEGRGFVGFTPSHLEEHDALGQPVKVQYFEEDGLLVIILVTDG